MTPIVVVSGLPRSGTSMMMQMLRAGGVPVLSDGARVADEDNPEGYLELEAARRFADRDGGWLDGAEGRAVKVVSWLLPGLPPGRAYDVVFLRRDLDEVLRSQQVMLARRGAPPVADEEGLRRDFIVHLGAIEAWLRERPGVRVVYVNHRRVLEAPREAAERVRRFLGLPLDLERMAASVSPALYRQRAR